MKKQLYETALQNELAGSAFFARPKQEDQAAIPKKTKPTKAKQTAKPVTSPGSTASLLTEQAPLSTTVPPTVLPTFRPPVRPYAGRLPDMPLSFSLTKSRL